MSLAALVHGARYATCLEPGCSHVRRNFFLKGMKPLIHNGRKP